MTLFALNRIANKDKSIWYPQRLNKKGRLTKTNKVSGVKKPKARKAKKG